MYSSVRTTAVADLFCLHLPTEAWREEHSGYAMRLDGNTTLFKIIVHENSVHWSAKRGNHEFVAEARSQLPY